MNLAALTTAIALSASTVSACDSISLHLTSFHTDRDLIQDVNERNIGLGCRIGSYEVGGYVNSYDDLTAYAIRDFTHDSGFGLFAGIATGYQDDVAVPDHGVTFVGGAVFHADAFTVRATPSLNAETDAFGAVFSLSLNIGDLK